MSSKVLNPYVGPRTFEEADGRFYFGREREARELLSLTITEPLLLFHAQSGAGKSSLLNTRLIPGLRQHGYHVLPVGRVGGVIPEGIKGIENVFAFNLIMSLQQDTTFAHTLTRQTISQYLQLQKKFRSENESESSGTTFLIIDQFEEILTTNLDHWQERTGFFRQLGEAIRSDPLLWVVLVLREDYVPALSPYARYLPGRLKARYHMQRMKLDAAREAIEKPAATAQRPFTPDATSSLIANLCQIRSTDPNNPFQQGEFIEPVQLQVVCYQLWENLKDSAKTEITLDDIQTVGDVDTALAQFYESAVATVLKETHTSEIGLRNWFDRQIITSGNTRGTVYMGQETTAGLPNHIVRLLANQYLLRSEIRAGGTWYELVHDRFVEPILQANKTWQAGQHPVVAAAEVWDRNGRSPDKLWQGQQLATACEQIDLTTAEPLIQAFLADCQAHQSQHDLEIARTKAEADAERAGVEAKSARQARRRSVWLGIGIFVIIVATVMALLARSSAQAAQETAVNEASTAQGLSATAEIEGTRAANNRGTAIHEQATANAEQTSAHTQKAYADDQKATADAASTVAIEQRQTANAAAVSANEQKATADAASTVAVEQAAVAQEAGEEAEKQSDLLLTQSLAFNARSIADKELSALLALEAYRISQRAGGTQQNVVWSTLLPVVNEPYFNIKLAGHDGAVTAVAYHPQDSQLAYSVGEDGTVRQWDLSQPQKPFTILQDLDTALNDLALTSDGSTLFAAGENGRIYYWPLAGLDPDTVPQQIESGRDSPIRQIDISPDNNRLLTADAAGNVDVWSWRAVPPNSTPIQTDSASFHPAVFDQWDSTLSVGMSDGGIVRAPLFSLSSQEAPEYRINEQITAVTTYPGGNAFAGAEGTLYIERNNGEDIRVSEHIGPINSIAIAPNNRTAASAGSDGVIKIWDFPDSLVDTTTASATLIGHEGPVLAVAYAPDGRSLLSAGADGSLRFWQIDLPTTNLERADVLFYTPDGTRLLAVDNSSRNGRLTLYDNTQNPPQAIATTREANGIITNLVLAPDGETVYAAVYGNILSGIVRPYALSDLATVKPPILSTAFGVNDIAISPDGTWLAVAGASDGTILLKSLSDPKAAQKILRGHRLPVAHLLFTPDGSQLISTTGYSSALPESNLYLDPDSQETRLWQTADFAANPSPASKLLVGKGASDIAISPDGQTFALAADNIQLWNIGTWGEPRSVLPDSTLPVPSLPIEQGNYAALAFAPDSMGIAAADFFTDFRNNQDVAQVRFWRLDDLLAAPLVLENNIRDFSASSRYFLFTNRRNDYFRLDVNRYNDVLFDPQGGAVAVASDGITRLWATFDRLPEFVCQQVHRPLTEEEWTQYLVNEPFSDTTCADLAGAP